MCTNITIACGSTLFGCQQNPFAHTLLGTLLLVGLHGRITPGNFEPFFAARCIQLTPVSRER